MLLNLVSRSILLLIVVRVDVAVSFQSFAENRTSSHLPVPIDVVVAVHGQNTDDLE